MSQPQGNNPAGLNDILGELGLGGAPIAGGMPPPGGFAPPPMGGMMPPPPAMGGASPHMYSGMPSAPGMMPPPPAAMGGAPGMPPPPAAMGGGMAPMQPLGMQPMQPLGGGGLGSMGGMGGALPTLDSLAAMPMTGPGMGMGAPGMGMGAPGMPPQPISSIPAPGTLAPKGAKPLSKAEQAQRYQEMLKQKLNQAPAAAGQGSGQLCANCGVEVRGRVVSALGKAWHPEHFNCAECSQPFHNGRFFNYQGLPYCEQHYRALFGPKCGMCNKPVTGQCVNALNKRWHRHCFVCVSCQTPLAGQRFASKEGRPFCKNCADHGFVMPFCKSCSKPIVGEALVIKGEKYHAEHFKCGHCNNQLVPGGAKAIGSKPFCTNCYTPLSENVCAAEDCGEAIIGKCISAMGKKYHPDHFCCHTCKKPFTDTSIYTRDGHAYCKEDYQRLFSAVCAKCKKSISADTRALNALGKVFHSDCFNCHGCERPLAGSKFLVWDNRALCNKCFKKLPSAVKKQVQKFQA